MIALNLYTIVNQLILCSCFSVSRGISQWMQSWIVYGRSYCIGLRGYPVTSQIRPIRATHYSNHLPHHHHHQQHHLNHQYYQSEHPADPESIHPTDHHSGQVLILQDPCQYNRLVYFPKSSNLTPTTSRKRYQKPSDLRTTILPPPPAVVTADTSSESSLGYRNDVYLHDHPYHQHDWSQPYSEMSTSSSAFHNYLYPVEVTHHESLLNHDKSEIDLSDSEEIGYIEGFGKVTSITSIEIPPQASNTKHNIFHIRKKKQQKRKEEDNPRRVNAPRSSSRLSVPPRRLRSFQHGFQNSHLSLPQHGYPISSHDSFVLDREHPIGSYHNIENRKYTTNDPHQVGETSQYSTLFLKDDFPLYEPHQLHKYSNEMKECGFSYDSFLSSEDQLEQMHVYPHLPPSFPLTYQRPSQIEEEEEMEEESLIVGNLDIEGIS